MSEWREVSLGAVCSHLRSGKNITAKDIHEAGEVPVFGGNGIRGYTSEYNFSGECAIIGRQGAYCGNVRYFNGSAHMSEHAVVACADVENDTRFLAYLLSTMNLRRLSSQAAQPGLSVRVLAKELLRVPPLAVQQRIASVIGSMDDLIENNRRRIEVLEEMARAIYREWFVKFRYPGHEDVPMVDSALGPIPEGWQIGRVDSLILLQRGFDLPLKVRESGPIPVVGASGVQGSHLAAKATGPGVVTGRSGTIGVVNYVPGDFWPLNTSLWVREFRLATPRYAYFLLEGLDLKRAASGSAVPSLDRKVVHGLPVVCPPPNLIEGWDTRVAGMFEAVEALRSQSTRLSAIRDLLLPKLVTGQIDVSTLDLDALVSTGSTEESAVAQ